MKRYQDGWAWPEGAPGKYLHRLHCRADRCSFGCDCPCHHGVSMRLTFAEWLAGQLRRALNKLRRGGVR